MNTPYPAHPSFPPNSTQSQHHLSYANPQVMQSTGSGAIMTPQDLASLGQQGYIQQQQQLAQAQILARLQAGASGSNSGIPVHSGTPVHKKKNKLRPTPQAQMLPRHTQHLGPPHSSEHYLQHAMSGPSDVEPWADALDEVDPREMAMGRFRARQEMLGEVFGPERIKDIPLGKGDAWKGLGIDGEMLEAKVQALEEGNAEMEAKMETELEVFRRRLQDVDSGAM